MMEEGVMKEDDALRSNKKIEGGRGRRRASTASGPLYARWIGTGGAYDQLPGPLRPRWKR